MNFWTKFTQEKYLHSKTEKVNIIIEFCMFKLILVPNFSLSWQFWSFWPDLPKKGFSGLKQKKWTPLIFYTILHFQISLVQNFSSNWQFWFFGPNLPKRYFQSKTGKVNIIIEFCIFKLVLVPNFSLNWQYWFFWLDLSKKVFSGLKQKKWTSHVFYIMLHIQISLMWNWSSKWQFWFFGSNLAKRVFPVANRKSHYHHGILHIWISLGTKFQLKLIISSFWTNFT